MSLIQSDDPVALAVVSALQTGNVDELRRILAGHAELAVAGIVDARGTQRTLLHVVTDWPGHFANAAQSIALLTAAGADVDAPAIVADGAHAETPLHWAASCDDVAAIDALLDSGADIEAPGAIFTGGSPLSDAVVFRQWNAARRLIERGARMTLWQSAALGALERVVALCSSQPAPSAAAITNAFWNACRGGQRATAEYLLQQGPDLSWVGPDGDGVLAAAEKSGNPELVAWLRIHGKPPGR